VIVQGVEAGGHVRGTVPAHDLLARIRETLPEMPLWLAGGIADAVDVRRALDAGAEAAVLGTRFVMTNESRAHPDYKARLQAAH
jgi:nitronate monooxygenase